MTGSADSALRYNSTGVNKGSGNFPKGSGNFPGDIIGNVIVSNPVEGFCSVVMADDYDASLHANSITYACILLVTIFLR
jgi:hypothetical protein